MQNNAPVVFFHTNFVNFYQNSFQNIKKSKKLRNFCKTKLIQIKESCVITQDELIGICSFAKRNNNK